MSAVNIAQRSLLDPFLLANPLYAGARVFVYVANTTTGKATSTLAPLYRAPVGSQAEANPLRLDGDGKLQRPVYVDRPVVARIRADAVAPHDTGVIGLVQRFRGDWEPGATYQVADVVRDGAAGADTGNLYIATATHEANTTWLVAQVAGKWQLYVEAGAPGEGTAIDRDYATPDDYGAVGDGESRPAGEYLGFTTLAELQAYNDGIYWFAPDLDADIDTLAAQAMFYDDTVTDARGRAGAHYIWNRNLHLRCGLISRVNFAASFIDAVGFPATSPSGVNLITNGTFVDGTGWQNTAIVERTDVVFGGGAASFTEPAPGTGYSFGQFGQEVTLPAGRWTVSALLTLTEGLSGGQFGRPYLGFGWTAFGVGQGYDESPVTKSVTFFDDGPEVIGFSFELKEEATIWLTFSGGNCNWTVEEVVVTHYYLNALIWCDGADFGRQPFDSTTWIGGEFLGPGANSGVRCFLHQTLEANDTRCHVLDTNVMAFEGGHVFADQAFLEIIRGGSTGYCNPCIQFVAGSENAGENIRITDHVFYNSDLAFDLSGGGEFFFRNVSTDYCAKFLRADRGAVITYGGHWEAEHPATTLAFTGATGTFDGTLAGGTSGATARVIEAPEAEAEGELVVEVLSGTFVDGETITGSAGGSGTTDGAVDFADVMWDLRGGSLLDCVDGEILMAGAEHRGNEHLVRLQSNADTIILPPWVYNIQTASGTFATGAGRVKSRAGHLLPTNALLPKMLIRTFGADLYAGTGMISGPNTHSDSGFTAPFGGPEDGIGFLYAGYSNTPNNVGARAFTDWEYATSIDTGDAPQVGGASLKLEYNSAYSGGVDFRVFCPARPGDVIFHEFQWTKPDQKDDILHGPFSATEIRTTQGSSIITLKDSNMTSLAGNGPQVDWGIEISGALGVGGISAGVLNDFHTVLERTAADEITIELGAGNEATSTASGGGGSLTSDYTQNSVLIFERYFWVSVLYFDAWNRPVIGNVSFQGESNFLVPHAATEWQKRNFQTSYTEVNVPDDPLGRVSRGRAEDGMTHLMVILNWHGIRECDPADPPPLYLSGFYANRLGV